MGVLSRLGLQRIPTDAGVVVDPEVLERLTESVAERVTEGLAEQVAASGAAGAWSLDPLDGERGWTQLGAGPRAVSAYTLERARTLSVNAYRTNPMGRAVIDTYTSFCVGDKGLGLHCTNPEVRAVVEEFWHDPKVRLGGIQEPLLRTHLLMGETALELMTGRTTGVTRFSPIDTTSITGVDFEAGNPLWPQYVWQGTARSWRPAQVNDLTGLRDGNLAWWPDDFKALITDRRGMPFMTPILDWLDSYDQLLSNLIDRTALARYLVWDVTVKGEQKDVDAFVAARGGKHVPPSGSVEVHNESVSWDAKSAQTGAYEDSNAAGSVLTLVAGGAGLAKTWLAEPDGANRATSLTMAEPVRRRVAGVQRMWVAHQEELVRYVIDQAVKAGRLPVLVDSTDAANGTSTQVPPSRTVRVTSPEVAASDAQITAEVLLNVAKALDGMRSSGALSPEAAKVAAQHAWEQFVGVPYTADLDSPTADPGDLATHVDEATPTDAARMRVV